LVFRSRIRSLKVRRIWLEPSLSSSVDTPAFSSSRRLIKAHTSRPVTCGWLTRRCPRR